MGAGPVSYEQESEGNTYCIERCLTNLDNAGLLDHD